MTTNSKIILGIVAGVSVGIITGMLLSPEKGAETRKRILDKASDLGNSFKDALVDFIKGGQLAEDAVAENSPASDMRLNTMG